MVSESRLGVLLPDQSTMRCFGNFLQHVEPWSRAFALTYVDKSLNCITYGTLWSPKSRVAASMSLNKIHHKYVARTKSRINGHKNYTCVLINVVEIYFNVLNVPRWIFMVLDTFVARKRSPNTPHAGERSGSHIRNNREEIHWTCSNYKWMCRAKHSNEYDAFRIPSILVLYTRLFQSQHIKFCVQNFLLISTSTFGF